MPLSKRTMKPSLGTYLFRGSSSGYLSNPYCPMKNQLTISSLFWLRSGWHKMENNKILFCYFWSLRSSHSFSDSPGSFKLLNTNSGGILHRCFTVSSSNGTFNLEPNVHSEVPRVSKIFADQPRLKQKKVPPKFVLEIADIIMNHEDKLESRLIMQSGKLSIHSITEIFEYLNSQRISGLRFFEWFWNTNHQLCRSALLCSLIIDNLGRLGDYETMFIWCKKFTSENIVVTCDAFRFLVDLASTSSSQVESTKRVVDLLKKAGGSCRNTGVCGLVEMFCKHDLFEMARYVVQLTERRESYYCLMIREKCRRGLLEDAYSIIMEMRETQCATEGRAHNYILGRLCKNGRLDEAAVLLEEMKGIDIQPDAITCEIFIISACNLGRMDAVPQLLNHIKSQGIEPRPTTLAYVIKSFFAAKKYGEAHKFVVDSSIIYKTSTNLMYNKLARLYLEKGDILMARNSLVEMMERNLKPDFTIYNKVVKQLRRIGRESLARDLETMQSSL